MENVQVKKRDGQIVPFESSKISRAVSLSAGRINMELSEEEHNIIIDNAIKDLHLRGLDSGILLVDDIHLAVENVLWSFNRELYKEYRSYNNYKRRFNHSFNNILTDSRNIMHVGDKENANKNSCLVGTKKDLCGGLLSKELMLEYELPKNVSKRHKDGDLYVHDLDNRYYQSINCCLFNLGGVLEGGFRLNGYYIEEPSTIETAVDLTNDIIQCASSQQYGK